MSPPKTRRLVAVRGRPVVLAVGIAGIAACASPSGPGRRDDLTAPGLDAVGLELVTGGLTAPVYATSPVADPRLFIVEQNGIIRVMRNGGILPAPFLDLRDRVLYRGEQGLLGLAFDPDFRASNRFFVSYTTGDGALRIERYQAIERTDRADPNTAELVLQIPQPFDNHNGGQISFGPDGMLYVGVGDGGGGGDPEGNGQDPGTLLGAILRLDVTVALPYAVPKDNPFAASPGGRPEVWAYGLRNPWRFSFDPETETLFIGDVGQNRWEEIDAVPAEEGGLNFGWNVMEGAECFAAAGCRRDGLVLPVLTYDHDHGCSVTGGYVYRGSRVPALRGRYVYSDFCEGDIRTFALTDGIAADTLTLAIPRAGRVTSFGVDAEGELYFMTTGGGLYRLVESG